jgi:hypothetical protein
MECCCFNGITVVPLYLVLTVFLYDAVPFGHRLLRIVVETM